MWLLQTEMRVRRDATIQQTRYRVALWGCFLLLSCESRFASLLTNQNECLPKSRRVVAGQADYVYSVLAGIINYAGWYPLGGEIAWNGDLLRLGWHVEGELLANKRENKRCLANVPVADEEDANLFPVLW